MDQFVVLDLETTGINPHKDKIIEIAAIKFVNFEPVKGIQSLVNPRIPLPTAITNLTGITQNELDAAPSWSDIQDEVLDFIDGQLLVGHNLRCFDIRFINAAMGFELPNPILDTLDYSRFVFPRLPSHKLSYLKTVLGINVENSHRALDDVKTTAALLTHCISAEYNPDYPIIPDSPPIKQNTPKPRKRYETIKLTDIVPTCACTDFSSPLCGKTVVFTGTLSIPRKEAMQLAVNVGAKLKNNVSRKTDYLVVGQQDVAIVGIDGKSNKEEAALEINSTGKGNIQIISEEDFIKLVTKEGILA